MCANGDPRRVAEVAVVCAHRHTVFPYSTGRKRSPADGSPSRAVDALEDFGSLVCSCTNENFERVVVRRIGQPQYVTEFIACTDCGAMYWRPIPKPSPPASLGVTWIGPEPGAPDPGRKSLPWTPEPKPETPEDKARFMAAVNRANKRKKRRR